MKNLAFEVKNEIERLLKHYLGRDWIAIHKNTAKHILELLNKQNKKK